MHGAGEREGGEGGQAKAQGAGDAPDDESGAEAAARSDAPPREGLDGSQQEAVIDPEKAARYSDSDSDWGEVGTCEGITRGSHPSDENPPVVKSAPGVGWGLTWGTGFVAQGSNTPPAVTPPEVVDAYLWEGYAMWADVASWEDPLASKRCR